MRVLKSRLRLTWQQGWRLAIALSVSLLLAACQPFSSQGSQTPLTLTLWHGINPPPNRDVFNELVADFNADHPNVQINPLYVGQPDQQLPKILTAVVGGLPPDLLWFTPMITGQLVELEGIHPLNGWFDDSVNASQLNPALLEAMTLEDQIWSIPMATNNLGLFYRPSLFEAAGIDSLPRTWQELRQVARTLTVDNDGDGRPDRHGLLLSLGKGEWTVFTWLGFLYGMGGSLIEDGVPNLVTPEAIAALQFWADLVADGSVKFSQPERGYELNDYLAGRVAMQLTGPWTLGKLKALDIDYDAMPIPAGQQQATVLGGEHLFVMKTRPERQQAALEFLEFVLSDRFQTRWALGTGYLPVTQTAQDSQAYQAYVSDRPILTVFLEQMSGAHSRPIIANYARLSDSLGRAIEQTLLGADPVEALETAQRRIDRIWQQPSGKVEDSQN
jgi:multiple sugar transport system substrate-binding protein